MTSFQILPISAVRLDRMRERGYDEHGNPWVWRSAEGWEPLRCCLRIARDTEAIALIAYQPLPGPSPWAEVGPVYVHRDPCGGYDSPTELPEKLVESARVLRSYDAQGSLMYDRLELANDAGECQTALRRLFADERVDVVHVRALLSQCFAFAVVRRQLK